MSSLTQAALHQSIAGERTVKEFAEDRSLHSKITVHAPMNDYSALFIQGRQVALECYISSAHAATSTHALKRAPPPVQ